MLTDKGGELKKALLLLSTLIVAALGQGMLTNGDFEQDLSVGWSMDTMGYTTRLRDVGYQPDADYEVMDSLIYQGKSRIYQIVEVPGPRLLLDFWAKFDVYSSSSTCWGVASVNVEYYDALNNLLGETRVYRNDNYCLWVPSGTMSLIPVTNPDWTEYSLDIANELSTNLPSINPTDVKKLGIAIVDTTAGG
jgi:hypothetical protein